MGSYSHVAKQDRHIAKWEEYRDSRRGTYEFRCRTRYVGVLGKLQELGLGTYSTVMDVGAGSCQFGRYLRSIGWRGLYVPVDAVLDGTDLEDWTFTRPVLFADFVVSIEVAEHLSRPLAFLNTLEVAAGKGVVVTTPNPAVVDVRRCDPTHVSEISATHFRLLGWDVSQHSWFHEQDEPGQLDTLMAWRRTA